MSYELVKERWQSRDKRKNEQRIVRAIAAAPKCRIRFTELLTQTHLSRPVLAAHLKRMKQEGKIGQGISTYNTDSLVTDSDKTSSRETDKSYFLTSKTLTAFKLFRDHVEPKHLRRRVIYDSLENNMDANKLAPFSEKEEQAEASRLVAKLVNLYNFTVLKMLDFFEQGDNEVLDEWFETCFLEMLPLQTMHSIDGYIKGEHWIYTKEGSELHHYLGDGIDVPSSNPPIAGKKLRDLRSHYKTHAVRSEIERRLRLRRCYLKKAITEISDRATVKLLKNDLRDSEQYVRKISATLDRLETKGKTHYYAGFETYATETIPNFTGSRTG